MKKSSSSLNPSPSVIFILCAIGFFCCGAYFMFIALEGRSDLVHRIVKSVPCFLLAIWVLLDRTPSILSRFVAIALICAAIGDWIIVGTGEMSFLLGVAAYLLVHIWYIVGFTHQFRKLKPLRAIVPLLFAIVLNVFFLRHHLEGVMQLAIFAYSIIIALMAWRAMVSLGAKGRVNKFEILLSLGACLFMVSDTLISINRFVTPIPHPDFWIMTLYWGSQFLLAYSTINLRRRVESTL